MNDLERINEKVKREVALKKYTGDDRIVLAQDKWEEIQEELKHRPSFSVKFGLPKIDECLSNLGLGRVVVLSGPPKNGKTQLCQTFTKRFCDQGKKVSWFSYEVGYEELFGKFPMKNLDFYVPNLMVSGNLDWIEDRIIEGQQKFGTQIVFIDHLDFLRDEKYLKSVNINMASYVGGLVQRIKRISVERNILIFLMAHITKTEWASNNMPKAEDLRDSGQVAQLADVVMMITRKRNKEKGRLTEYVGTEATVGVIENRLNGKTVLSSVVFKDGEFFELVNPYEQNYEPQRNISDPDEEWKQSISDRL